MLRTHDCGELRAEQIGQVVTLAGWVNRRRDHGGLAFIDLRDRYGMTQVVLDPEVSAEACALGAELGQEWVIAVDGEVRARIEGQTNADMPTGEIELLASAIRVLNPSKVPPFEVARDQAVDDSLRLRYRYLDLRRERMKSNILLRHRVNSAIRRFMDREGFIEVETPILMKATPEGARDFLVPSRVHHGRFYALPQSPQQLKQILMVAGIDRYYQIARCFRDEDLRADRELEFSQLDVEMSFVDSEDVMALTERLLIELCAEVMPERPLQTTPFPRMAYAEAMERYGSDKPDLRFGLELVDVGPVLAESEFRVFADTIAGGGRVKVIAVPQSFSRREIDELEALMKSLGARGLAWLAWDEAGEPRGSVARFLSPAEIAGMAERAGASPTDTLFIVAGDDALVAKCLGRLRLEMGQRLGLIDESVLAFLWIIEPPVFELNPEEERWDSVHHPFTAPDPRDLAALEADPGAVRALAYDVVLNGYEIGGGSIRIHDRAVQTKVFELLGLSDEQTQAQFGHLLTAFDYGAPPHGGIAWGLDRLVAIFAGESNIRDVIAFPKSLKAIDLLTGAPSPVPTKDLDVLGICIAEPSAPPDASAPLR
jgi:aspartyl-tRNA synthetase